jgi:hypothetical protein
VKLKKHIACVLGACALVLIGGSIRPVSAQTSVVAGSTAALQHWNPADETSFSGTIHEVTTEHTSGNPAGVNLLMDSSPSFQYANLGAGVNSSLKSELAAGQAVTLKGIVRSFNGHNVLMVRQITINQRTTQVRSAHGIATPLVEASALQGNRPRGRNAVSGGAQ